MKKTIACFVIILFSLTGFSQVNKHASKMKRKGIKEFHLFEERNDSFPVTTLYYDREGRLTKMIYIRFYGDSPLTWEVLTTEYDTAGRAIKKKTNYTSRYETDKMIFFRLNDEEIT